MNKLLFPLIILCLCSSIVKGQILFSEDFEEGHLPDGWEQQTLSIDDGWIFDEPNQISSTFWNIIDNNSKVAATSDDSCDCNKSEEYLITPPISIGNLGGVILNVDAYFEAKSYQGITEYAAVLISMDGGENWTTLLEIEGANEWQSLQISLSEYKNQEIQLAFYYSDREGWLYGLAVDNISISETSLVGGKISDITTLNFGEVGTPIDIKGKIFNTGGNVINSIEVTYYTQEQIPVSHVFGEANIQPLDSVEFIHPIPWIPDDSGNYELVVKLNKVNGVAMNSTTNKKIEIYDKIETPNIIGSFFSGSLTFNAVADEDDFIDKPTDLDFFPIAGKNELWICNERSQEQGGSLTILSNAGKSNQTINQMIDTNAKESMALPTGIAFSDNGNFATTSGIQDIYQNEGTYAGPTLWSSNEELLAQSSDEIGLHIDMLHGSPFSMGIAYERENIYWVYDGYNKEIVRYDFQNNNGIGTTDFSDGIIRRYPINIKRNETIPSHMVLDESSNWLYLVDNGNQRVLRLDITSGQYIQTLPETNEPLAEHTLMGNFNWEEVITNDLESPSGIEIFEDRLLVSDYENGNIIIYDVNTFIELGRIETGSAGVCGIKIGPEGNIWYTNRLENKIYKIAPASTTSTESIVNNVIGISPNPTNGIINLDVPNDIEITDTIIFDASGKIIETINYHSNQKSLSIEHLPDGMYFIQLKSAENIYTNKIIKN